MGVFTTIIFWGTEIAFDILFQDPNAKYLGAVIGLSIGYVIKYFLDKRYVFIHKEEITVWVSWVGECTPRLKILFLSLIKKKTLRKIINEHDKLIPYGNGRSYGDSALSY